MVQTICQWRIYTLLFINIVIMFIKEHITYLPVPPAQYKDIKCKKSHQLGSSIPYIQYKYQQLIQL